MNQVSLEQKDQVLKSMAIIGFIAVIIFGVWLAVKIVGLMPTAFSSLASIADGVYNYRPDTTEETVEAPTPESNGGAIVLTTDEFSEDTAVDEPEIVIEEEEVKEVAVEVPVVKPPTTPTTPPAPTTPTIIETITHEVPKSNPNGYTDLATRLLGVGELDANGNFVKGSGMYGAERGAFQFEVKNVGTKTSSDWDFTATLTNGVEYDAPKQTSLKPQERVVFTLGYGDTGTDGIHNIGVDVNLTDKNASNNSFTWAVVVR